MERKVSEADTAPINDAIEKLKGLKEGEDAQAIKDAIQELNEAIYPIAQKMYEQTAQSAETDQAQSEDDNSNVEEADFEEIKDDE